MSVNENSARPGFATASRIQDGHPARSSLSRTWTPQHGIVFGTGQTYRGLSTAASEDTLRGLLLLSDAEDSYVLADAVKLDPQSTGISSIAQRTARKVVKKEEKRSSEVPSVMKAIVDAKTLEALSRMISRGKPDEEKKVAGKGKKAEKEAKQRAKATQHELILLDPEQDKVPQTPTSFKMTEETFRAAKNAKAGSPESFWSHKLYRGAEDADTGAEGKKPIIHYCRSKATTERVLESFFMDQKVIGFDIEWKSEQISGSNRGIREHVSLIQIACEERIALFHLALYPKGDKVEDLSSPLLKRILEDPEVTKVGVAIKGDCTRVNKWLAIRTQGMFELSHLNKLVKYSRTKDFGKINKSSISLAKQVQEHLHLPMSKDLNVRASNWSKPLQLDQMLYAAADSYAGFQLFHTMEMKRKALDPMPPCPYHVEHDKPIRFVEEELNVVGRLGVDVTMTDKTKRRAVKRLAEEATSISEDDAEQLEGETSKVRPNTKRGAEDVSVEAGTVDVEGTWSVGELETEPNDDKDYVTSPQTSVSTTSHHKQQCEPRPLEPTPQPETKPQCQS